MDSRYGLGTWACTMKLCDVRTNPGLMREHGLKLYSVGLIRGWAYTRLGLSAGFYGSVTPDKSRFVHIKVPSTHERRSSC